MRFRVYIDATFDAEDIDQAMIIVARHVLEPLAGDDDTMTIGWLGGIDIGPEGQ